MKVAVVLPAYNAEKTLRRTLDDLPTDKVEYIILVDDASSDGTVSLARELGIDVILHGSNRGYGGNQKSCYDAALATDADVIVMLHPDYQYDSRVVPLLAEIIRLGICDVVLGNRIRTRREARQGGMPLWKYLINRSSTFGENFVLGQSLGDFHSGLRAYSRLALERVPYHENSDDFSFDQEFLIQASYLKLKLGDIPVPVRYFPEASSINVRRSAKYGLDTLRTFLCLGLHAAGVSKDPRFIARC